MGKRVHMLRKIDHIGIAVRSIESVKLFFNKVFHLSPLFEETVEDQQVKVVGFRVGDSTFEFLEPTHPDSAIAKFLDKRGEGIHHLSMDVDNIESALATLKSADIRLIDNSPRIGAEGKKIAFVHPKGIFGILLELSEQLEDSNRTPTE